MRIEPFDPVAAAEPAALAYAALVADARRCVTPEGTRLPAAYTLNRLRNVSDAFRTATWLAYDAGGVLAGAAEAYWREAPDNRDRAWVHLDVPAEHATEPVLDALAAAVAAHCAAAGRPVLTVEVEQGSPHSAWVAARGGRLGSLDEHQVLALRSVRRADLAALAAAPDGYDLLRWDGPAPDDLVGAYVRLVGVINDAPTDDLTMQPAVFSPARLRDWEKGLALRGHTLWTVVARHVASGELAAYNQLELRPEWPEVVENQDTAVARPHRGRGLGVRVKAVNLLRVVDERPDAACVSTWNAASNEHMLRVNRRLGFARQHVVEQWELAAPALLAEEPA